MIRYLFISIFFVLTCIPAVSQSVNVKAFYDGKSVYLRWYPSTVEEFRDGAKNGFLVERREVGSTQWQRIVTVMAAVYEGFDKMSERNEKASLVGFSLYQDEVLSGKYGTIDSLTSDDGISIESLTSKEAQDYNYKFALIACEFDTELAKNAALFHQDVTAAPGKNYQYRVLLKSGAQVTGTPVSISTSSTTELPKFKAEVDQNDYTLDFEWNVQNLELSYSGYDMEYSMDGKQFKKLNSNAIVQLSTNQDDRYICRYHTKLPTCGQYIYYRVAGLTPFGIYGPYTPVMKLYRECDYTVSVKIDTVEFDSKNVATVKWSIDNPNKEKIKDITIEHATTSKSRPGEEGPHFDVIADRLSASKRSYVDLKAGRVNYYRVKVNGPKSGQYVQSKMYTAIPVDSVPPKVPTGLKGRIDSTGLVTLEWDKNTDDDIMAYRVFSKNGKDDDPVSCVDTYLVSNTYTQRLSLGTLTNAVYYQVLAVDRNYNHSALCAPIKLMKPDTIPPVAALIQNVNQMEDFSIQLSWVNSSSSDLQKVILLKEANNSKWDTLAVWGAGNAPEQYLDISKYDGETVVYCVKSIDESGNETPSYSIPVMTKDRPVEYINNLTFVKDYNKGGVQLKWNVADSTVEEVGVYKKTPSGKLVLLKTFDSTITSYFDQKVVRGKKYKYILAPLGDKQGLPLSTGEFEF